MPEFACVTPETWSCWKSMQSATTVAGVRSRERHRGSGRGRTTAGSRTTCRARWIREPSSESHVPASPLHEHHVSPAAHVPADPLAHAEHAEATGLVQPEARHVLGKDPRLERPDAGVLGGATHGFEQRAADAPPACGGSYVDALLGHAG